MALNSKEVRRLVGSAGWADGRVQMTGDQPSAPSRGIRRRCACAFQKSKVGGGRRAMVV